jgi:hypothetical protein
MRGELKNTQKKPGELDLSGYGDGPLARYCKNGNNFFGFVKALNFFIASQSVCSRSSLSLFLSPLFHSVTEVTNISM